MNTIIPEFCLYHNEQWHNINMCELTGDICEPCAEYKEDKNKKEMYIEKRR
jgi:hypothetical protein